MDRVVRYYWRMARENGLEWAMGFTLEMFEGLTAAQVEAAIASRDMDGAPLFTVAGGLGQ